MQLKVFQWYAGFLRHLTRPDQQFFKLVVSRCKFGLISVYTADKPINRADQMIIFLFKSGETLINLTYKIPQYAQDLVNIPPYFGNILLCGDFAHNSIIASSRRRSNPAVLARLSIIYWTRSADA